MEAIGSIVRKQSVSGKSESFVEKHSAGVVFAISTLALLILSPLSFFLGTAAGYAIHNYNETPVNPEEKIITIVQASLTCIGAMAALIAVTSIGATGGLLFQAIPFLSSLCIGTCIHNATQSLDDSTFSA